MPTMLTLIVVSHYVRHANERIRTSAPVRESVLKTDALTTPPRWHEIISTRWLIKFYDGKIFKCNLVFVLMKKRRKDSHKNENGRVLVVGGSEKYPGAVYLAASAIAALRLGADLGRVACPEKVAWAINAMNPDLITIKLPGKKISFSHMKKLKEEIEEADVVLFGNGLGRDKGSIRFARALSLIDKKKVIDGDALRFIDMKKVKDCVFTPHRAEFEDMLRSSGLDEKNFREALGSNVILLKGAIDRIYGEEKVRENKTGNEGMTVGGTGDVLAGLVAGFVSQGFSLEESAFRAARLNGGIGDKLKKELGYGFIASDFLKEIAESAKRLNLFSRRV